RSGARGRSQGRGRIGYGRSGRSSRTRLSARLDAHGKRRPLEAEVAEARLHRLLQLRDARLAPARQLRCRLDDRSPRLIARAQQLRQVVLLGVERRELGLDRVPSRGQSTSVRAVLLLQRLVL